MPNILHNYGVRYMHFIILYIVHPGIDDHFDIAFLNEDCGIVLHGSDFLELLKAHMASFLTGSFPWKCS